MTPAQYRPVTPARLAGEARIAVMFDNLGPYHLARLESAGKALNIAAIELGGRSKEYAWARRQNEQSFRRVTLFQDAAVKDQPARALTDAVMLCLDKLKPDAVAIPGWSDPGALAALSWCLNTGVPGVLMSDSTVLDAHRGHLKEFIKSRIVRLCSSAFCSGARAAAYVQMLGMAANRTSLGYDVVDNRHFMDGATSARAREAELRVCLGLPARYFLICCRLVAKKNIPGLLRAYAIYQQQVEPGQAWKLVIVGEGEMADDIRRLRSDLGLSDDVVICGFVGYDDITNYYALAGAFILSSTVEQWGLVVNEAMACGLPVLVSDRAGCVDDLVSEGVNGYSISPSDPEAMASKMTLLAHHSDLAAMGAASLAMVAEWSPERFTKGLSEAVSAALEAGPVRAGFIDLKLLGAVGTAMLSAR